MTDKCPHCEGMLLEKHEEFIVEQGEKMKVLHLRCIRCGKWTKQEIKL